MGEHAWTIIYQTTEVIIRARIVDEVREFQICAFGQPWHFFMFSKETAVQLINSLETVWEE